MLGSPFQYAGWSAGNRRVVIYLTYTENTTEYSVTLCTVFAGYFGIDVYWKVLDNCLDYFF